MLWIVRLDNFINLMCLVKFLDVSLIRLGEVLFRIRNWVGMIGLLMSMCRIGNRFGICCVLLIVINLLRLDKVNIGLVSCVVLMGFLVLNVYLGVDLFISWLRVVLLV